MKTDLVVRAWKDPEFRARLSAEERASLPDCPSGKPMTELNEEELHDIIGGRRIADVLGGNTGCSEPVQPTCGLVVCPIRELEL